MNELSETVLKQGDSISALAVELEGLLTYGCAMIRAGATAFRTREAIQVLARQLAIEHVSLQMSLGCIVMTGRQGTESVTMLREVGIPGVNSRRLDALEKLVHQNPMPGSRELYKQVGTIEGLPSFYSSGQIALAVGVACGAFAVLNGGMGLEVLAAALGAGIGQWLRSQLLHRRYNHYAVTALCALLASGLYTTVAAFFLVAGAGVPRHTIGFISSVLFLVPGFPLIAGLLDLLQYEFVAGITRLAYALLLLLSAALGLSFVIALVGFSLEPPLPAGIPQVVMFLIKVAASFLAGGGFAILFNSSWSGAVAVGFLSIAGNAVRLGLLDAGLGLGLATFAGSLAVGLLATPVRHWLDQPRITLTIPGVIMMVPGLIAFDALVLFNQDEILGALRAMVLVAFVVGAMALGLAVARFLTQPEWLKS